MSGVQAISLDRGVRRLIAVGSLYRPYGDEEREDSTSTLWSNRAAPDPGLVSLRKKSTTWEDWSFIGQTGRGGGKSALLGSSLLLHHLFTCHFHKASIKTISSWHEHQPARPLKYEWISVPATAATSSQTRRSFHQRQHQFSWE